MTNASEPPADVRERIARGTSVLKEDVVDPLETVLEGLPITAWCFIAGLLLVAFGFALESWGLAVEAGISGAMAVFFVGIAVFGQIVVWGLGILDRE